MIVDELKEHDIVVGKDSESKEIIRCLVSHISLLGNAEGGGELLYVGVLWINNKGVVAHPKTLDMSHLTVLKMEDGRFNMGDWVHLVRRPPADLDLWNGKRKVL